MAKAQERIDAEEVLCHFRVKKIEKELSSILKTASRIHAAAVFPQANTSRINKVKKNYLQNV